MTADLFKFHLKTSPNQGVRYAASTNWLPAVSFLQQKAKTQSQHHDSVTTFCGYFKNGQ
jgi:phage protein U